MVCGWLFFSNFLHLYFYCVLWNWNWNANAKLPLRVTAKFASLVYQDIGPVAAIACLAMGGITVASTLLGGERGRWNWRGLWCGVAPLAYPIGSGAELYGAVCEIAMFGFILFALAPMVPPARRADRRFRAVAAVIALAVTAASGV